LSSDEPPVPAPSDEVLIRLATLAAHVQEWLAADHRLDKTPVGLTTAKNDRRRAMESILVQLADAEVRSALVRAHLPPLSAATVWVRSSLDRSCGRDR
jgi:hypothetical protein